MTKDEYNAKVARKKILDAERTIHDPKASTSDVAACVAFLMIVATIALIYYAGATFILVCSILFAIIKFLFD